MSRQVIIYDTTLRDGTQAENFNLAGLPEHEVLIDSLSQVMHANKGKDYYK